jgi:hypothetical protein
MSEKGCAMRSIRVLVLLGLVLDCVAVAACAERPAGIAGLDRPDVPNWWKTARGFYCPFTDSGAGSSLMKYNAGGNLLDRIENFRNLPKVLDEARKLGTNVLYVVDYWEPGYEYKGEYVPWEKAGGGEAYRDGIEAVHKAGGRVIVYLEAFIVSRRTEWAKTVGYKWAMKDENGEFYPYYHTGDRFYLMWPGEGSGWTDHIVGLAVDMVRKYGIDGVHLDSYGVHQVLKDYNPDHPDGTEPNAFNKNALALIKRMRAEMRKYNPDAIVILEGAEHEDFLKACDGAQIESLTVLKKKKWYDARKYPIFTSSWELAEMEAILDEGYGLALSSWWLRAEPRGRDRKRLQAQTDKRNRFDQIQALNRFNNLLAANDIPGHLSLGFSDRVMSSIIRQLNARKWTGDAFTNPQMHNAIEKVTRLYEEHKEDLKVTPADRIRAWMDAAQARAAEALGRARGRRQ